MEILIRRNAERMPGKCSISRESTGERLDFVFHNDGEPINYRRIQYRYNKALKRAGLFPEFKATHILRKAMANIVRQNMGLETPHSIWFLGEMRSLVETCLTRERLERTGLLSYGPVRALWEEHLRGKRDNGRALWCVLSVLIWFELFVYDRDYKKHLGHGG